MSTSFVHIGDVHLQHGHPRNADRLQAFDQIIDETVPRGVAGVFIPGDLFHQRSTAEDRNELAKRLRRLADVAPVVLVRGNHDAPGDLDIFARLKATWPIYVITRPGVSLVPLANGETAAIAAVPYPDKFGLVMNGVAPTDVSQSAVELLDVIFMQLAQELEDARASGAIPIFLGHFNVRGAIASTGQPQMGHEQEIDRLSLERLQVVYCGLSHIHKPQEVGRGVYAGSIAAMDHGETERKYYVVVEAKRQADGDWSAAWTSNEIRTPPMIHVDGTLTRNDFLLNDAEPDVESRWHTDNWSGCDVRVRYSYNVSERAVLTDAPIRERFKAALRLKIEAVAIPDRQLRSPEVAAAKSLPEKLAAYRKETELPVGLAAKLARLQQWPTPEVLAEVAEHLASIESPERATVAA